MALQDISFTRIISSGFCDHTTRFFHIRRFPLEYSYTHFKQILLRTSVGTVVYPCSAGSRFDPQEQRV
ncbi:unnamed protein product [Clonostachys rosea f. rosea IK726]|uniref:Uncharacterized protein n=1 Tax=Clonostachys rosea f. rosea IK726 TaxID=1349383 RepID=A0ACA9UR77_BIOOC|nr:unnamed protein product [Clonostachys rosea f. rosea IK726]